MKNINWFLRSNFFALFVALLVVAYYLYNAFSGGMSCGCDTTEKYASQPASGYRSHSAGVHSFYHK